jgi:hypothetical protein
MLQRRSEIPGGINSGKISFPVSYRASQSKARAVQRGAVHLRGPLQRSEHDPTSVLEHVLFCAGERNQYRIASH